MDARIEALLERLKRQPSHSGTLILSLFGDAIMPRGGTVALATIIDLCGAMGIAAGVVRTAVSRLSADGWLVASRQSRASFYHPGPLRRGEFNRAARHIFGPARRGHVDRLSLVLFESGDAREALRQRLIKLGFVAWQGVMMAPERPLPPSVVANVTVLIARPDGDGLARLAAKVWRLDALANYYAGFIDAYAPLLGAIAELPSREAMIARLLLIHDYRRIALRDPRLPAAFLAPDWVGDRARALCAALYREGLVSSERWLDDHAVTKAGRLPPGDGSLSGRFADQPVRAIAR